MANICTLCGRNNFAYQVLDYSTCLGEQEGRSVAKFSDESTVQSFWTGGMRDDRHNLTVYPIRHQENTWWCCRTDAWEVEDKSCHYPSDLSICVEWMLHIRYLHEQGPASEIQRNHLNLPSSFNNTRRFEGGWLTFRWNGHNKCFSPVESDCGAVEKYFNQPYLNRHMAKWWVEGICSYLQSHSMQVCYSYLQEIHFHCQNSKFSSCSHRCISRRRRRSLTPRVSRRECHKPKIRVWEISSKNLREGYDDVLRLNSAAVKKNCKLHSLCQLVGHRRIGTSRLPHFTTRSRERISSSPLPLVVSNECVWQDKKLSRRKSLLQKLLFVSSVVGVLSRHVRA